MKAPYFELQADEEAKTAAGVVLADNRPVKFKRRRALNCLSTLFTAGDEHTRRCFDEGKDTYKGAYNRRAYAKNIAIYFVLFPALFLIFTVIFAAIIFLGTLQTAMAEIPALLVLFLIFWVVSGGAAVVLAAWRIYKGKYLKSAFYHLDDVYVVYAKSGAPCIICAEQNRIRVLYGEKLTVILKNGEQTETNPKKVYLAYLDMFPQSALDTGAFVKDRRKYFLADDTGYRKDLTAVFCEMTKGASLSVNATKTNSQTWKLHKILFDLDKDLNLTAVYSIAGRGYLEYVTLAEAVSRGGGVLNELNTLKEKNPALSGLLKEIL